MKTGNSRVLRRMTAKGAAIPERSSKESKRAIGYVRVSTEEQAETGLGLDIQRERVRAFIESQGYELLEVVEDAGFSGGSVNRPGLQRILQLAGERAFEVLVVYKFDRLSRSVADALEIVDKGLTANGVAVRSVSEPVDTGNEMGRFFFTMLASFAELEKNTIRKRTLEGRMEKAKQGGYAGGATPLGYKRDKEGGLVIDEEEAAVVRRMAELRKKGLGYKAIAKRLNEEGAKTKRGGQWYGMTVKQTLENAKYRGQVEYYFGSRGLHVLTEGHHEAILPGFQKAARA